MPPLLGTNYFQRAEQGWSETWPIQASDYSTALGILQTGTDLRLATLCPDVSHLGGRVSDVTVVGDALVMGPRGVGTFTPPNGVSAADNVVLLIRYNAGVKPHSIRGFHAVPASQITGPNYNPGAIFQGVVTNLNNWVVNQTAILTVTGKGAQRTFRMNPISTSVVLHLSTRKQGRPFGLRRGRRRVA